MTTTTTPNIAGAAVSWTLFSAEILTALYDLRWLLVLSFLLILTDFWFGSSEARMRYTRTKNPADRWRFSRAGRRTLNKAVDYLTYTLVSCVLGLAIFEPLHICDHTSTAAIGLGLGCLFDLNSIIGHVCTLHGVRFNLFQFLRTLLRTHKADIADALDKATKSEKEENLP